MGASHLIYLGTYTRTGVSKGIYTVRLDRETGRPRGFAFVETMRISVFSWVKFSLPPVAGGIFVRLPGGAEQCG